MQQVYMFSIVLLWCLGKPHLARPYNCVPWWCWWWTAENCCWLWSAAAVRVLHFVWWELQAQDGRGYCVKENQCKNFCIPGQLSFSQLTGHSKIHHILSQGSPWTVVISKMGWLVVSSVLALKIVEDKIYCCMLSLPLQVFQMKFKICFQQLVLLERSL